MKHYLLCRSHRIVRLAILTALAAAPAGLTPDADAALRTKAAGGNWQVNAGWTPGSVPTSSDWIVLGSSGKHYLNGNVSADSVTATFTSGIYELSNSSTASGPPPNWILSLYGTGLDSRPNVISVAAGGTLRFGDSTASGRAVATVNLAGAVTDFNFRVAAGGTLEFIDGPTTSDSQITGAGKNLSFDGGGTLTFATANTFGGVGNTFTLSAGTLNINVAGALGNVNNTFVVNGGSFGKSTAGSLTLNNYKHTWNSNFTFSGSADMNLGTGAVTLGGTVQANVAASRTLTVGGGIGDGASTYGLTKTGAGTLTLNGANTYNGVTTVAAGTLNLGASATLSGTSRIRVDSGAILNVSALAGGLTLGSGQTLSGSGSVVGTVTAGSGSTLSAGNSPGILSVDNLTLGTGSSSLFEVGGLTTAGVDFDQIDGTGHTLTYQTGWILNVAFTQPGPFTGSIQIFKFSNYSGTGNTPTINVVLGTADNVVYDTATGYLSFENAMGVVIPEPTTGVLFAGASLGLWLVRRRQHSRA